MHSTLNIWFILWLSCVIAIVPLAVDGSNASTGSKTILAPAEKADNTIIVNVNQDSRNVEKSIQSLETTLEKNFQQIIRAINASSLGNQNIDSGKMCHIVLKFIVL